MTVLFGIGKHPVRCAGNLKRSKRSQALSMTALFGVGKHPVRCAGNLKRSKRSQALSMTALFRVGKHPVRCQGNLKRSKKVRGSQDDGFVEVSWRNNPKSVPFSTSSWDR
jgi:hypothetical protein